MSKRPVNHKDKEARLRKACERLGSEDPHCILGHEASPFALELHHIAGQAFDDETVVLCGNHHDPVSDAQKDHPPRISDCANPLEGIGHILLGLAEILAVVLDELGDHWLKEFLTYLRWKLQEIGAVLIEYARRAPGETFGSVS